MPAPITELSAEYRRARDQHPVATVEEIAEHIMPRLSRDHIRALATDWRAMGASPDLGDDAAALGYVHNFVTAMDYPDDED